MNNVINEALGYEGKQGSSPQKLRRGWVLLICLFSAAGIFVLDIHIPLGVAGGVPYVAVVLFAQWHPQRRIILYVAILGSLLTIAGFFYSPPGGEMWKVLSNRLLALFAIWVTALLVIQYKKQSAEKEQVLLQREEAMEQVKVLRGFLPICASCKKIRDDGGYWNQIEAYIRDHSEAVFSHGICPDCVAKLYPELGITSEK